MDARVLIGLTGLAWGAIELALRLRLMFRHGWRARLRTTRARPAVWSPEHGGVARVMLPAPVPIARK